MQNKICIKIKELHRSNRLSESIINSWLALSLIDLYDFYRGWNGIATLADYQTIGDSASLAKIGDQSFTITFVEDSDYTQGENITKGVKITTKEMFEIDGNYCNKFHTTRVAIVKKFNNEKLREDVNIKQIPLGPVKCISEKSASGKNFFNLVDV